MDDAPSASALNSHPHLLISTYERQEAAQRAVRRVVDMDFPMDRISLLGKAFAKGDDVLGIYYPRIGERMKAWGGQGAVWAGLWGLLAGASGMFLIPGLGPIMAAGPVVEAIAGALAGASIGGGTMAAAAALSQIAVALHRLGVPREALEHLEQAIHDGHFVLVLQGTAAELGPCRELVRPGATTLAEFPGAQLVS